MYPILTAAAIVVPCLSTLVSDHGEPFIKSKYQKYFDPAIMLVLLLIPLGSASQKGTVMGILRSLGALARALGPVVSSSGEETETKGSFHMLLFS